MSLLRKIWRCGNMLLSQTWVPKSKRVVRDVHLQGFQILVLANEDVGRQIAVFKSYEPDETVFFRNNIRPEDICFDVGGNVGYFSMLMSQAANKGVVHVFEPVPLNAALIRASAELNGFSNVVINNVALGDEKGSASFSVSVDSAYSSLVATGRISEARNIEVAVLTIDNYVTEHSISKVDIMKVDVEGAEDLVIRGAVQLLSDAKRRPRIVLLELQDLNLKPFGLEVAAVIERMKLLGYEPKVLKADQTLESYDSTMKGKHYNFIFTTA